MSRKKKNFITLLVLVVVLAACLLLYFFVPKSNDSKDKTQGATDEETIEVKNFDQNDVTKIEVKKKGKLVYSLKKASDNWTLLEDKSIPVDKEAVSKLFKTISPLKATKKMDVSQDGRKDYSVQSQKDAYMSLSMTVSGKDVEILFGDKVPSIGGRYGIINSEDSSVFCFAEAISKSFDVSKNEFIKKDELPEIKSDYLTYISVDRSDDKDFEAKVVDESKRVAMYSKWNITKPYKEPLSTSSKNWSNTLDSFTNLEFDELISYASKDLGKYGLKTPQKIIKLKYFETTKGYKPKKAKETTVGNSSSVEVPQKYRKNKELTLNIGYKTKKGTYYVSLGDSSNVYSMKTQAVEAMSNISLEDNMDHCIYTTLATDIKGYDVSYGKKKFHITRTQTNRKNAKTNKNLNVWKINGKTVSDKDEDTFLTPYSAAYLLEYSTTADKKHKVSKKPVLTIVYHENNRDVTVKYLPYDGEDFYQVDRNNMTYFLVDKRSVDEVISKFKKIEKFAK